MKLMEIIYTHFFKDSMFQLIEASTVPTRFDNMKSMYQVNLKQAPVYMVTVTGYPLLV